ncbi:hypothetical protein H4S08_002664 [Coemansia sp. RSA 1365]|nr:hypothetical protein H4S08_002664 [Coemansia sp. RSA 1365]
MKDSIVEIVFEFIVKATEGYSLLLIGLLAKPAMLKAYRFISKECFADTNRNRINEATDADDFANRDQMLPQEIGNDLVEDNRHHNEAIGPRIQPMQANINVAEERVEPVRDELQAEQQPEPNVFKQESAKIFDMARVGRIEQALPSDEYYAHMQQAIDSALKSTYFLLAFTLQPNNMRVPGKHFMTIPNNRVARVPVNNFGLPVDSIYDYEVADNPQKRKRAISEGRVVPYPAINNVKVDMSFKAMDYSVVYVPSMFELRELVYMALTLFGLGMVIVLTLALALYIGGYILHPMYSDLRETASPFYLGLLVILAIGIAVIRGLRTFEKVFTFEKGLMKTLQIVFQNALEISSTSHLQASCSHGTSSSLRVATFGIQRQSNHG